MYVQFFKSTVKFNNVHDYIEAKKTLLIEKRSY